MRALSKGLGFCPGEVVAALIAALAITTSGCKKGGVAQATDDTVLMEYADSALTMSYVLSRIPTGVEAEDSTELFRRIADTWLENMALMDLATSNSQNLDRIERLVEDYRSQLIVDEYLSNMSRASKGAVTESAVKKYFDRQGESMTLDEPIVKGVYLKLPETDRHLDDVRRWMKSGTGKAVDNIERNGLSEALQYEYFGDRWVEWSSIASQIPYRFFDADAFLASTPYFETVYDGSVYMLRILDYVKSGDMMPYQYASIRIRRILEKENMEAARRKILSGIYRDAVKDGRLKTYSFSPFKR